VQVYIARLQKFSGALTAEVMELEFYDRPTCIKLGAFSHDASNVVCVVNKLDRRRRVLLTCRGDIFQVIAVATLSGNSLRQTVHTHRASVHQAEKLVAALLRVAGVTAGLAESMTAHTAGLTSPAG